VEAAATGFLVSYIMRSDQSMLAPIIAKGIPDLPVSAPVIASAEPPATSKRSPFRKLWILLGVLVALVPLGLLAPGEAFAEWGAEELEALIGFAPAGLKGLEGLYTAPMAGYTLPGLTDFTSQSLAYILAAIIGVSILGLSLFVWYRIRLKAGNADDP